MITNFKIFENNDYDANIQILKYYVKFLEADNDVHSSIMIKIFFIALHNYLILEKSLQLENTLNKNLNLKPQITKKGIHNAFEELYDPNHIIRNNIEKFSDNEIVKKILNDNDVIFNRILTDSDVENLIIGLEANKYNL